MNNFIKTITKIFAGIGIACTLCAGQAMALTVQDGADAARADGMPAELVGNEGVIHDITNIVLYLVGFIAVIMLIWGGLRYILSGGDSKKVTDAKNTILYALLGLIIAFFAYAIVNFVLGAIGASTSHKSDQQALLLLSNFLA